MKPFIDAMLPVIEKINALCLRLDLRELNQMLQTERGGPKEMEEVYRKPLLYEGYDGMNLTT